MSTRSTTPERMVIAIDPHKASWTAAVVDASLQPVATIRVPVSRDGYRALRRFANRWPDPTWAIEGASGLGAPLTARLRTDGIDVVDVPAKLAARVRMLSTGHGRKNDDADAVSVAIAARSARRLNSAAVDGAVTALRAIVEHRDDLVKTRTQTVNRLHVVLTNLIPAGADRDLTAERAAELLRGIRPRDAAGKTLRSLAADLVVEIRQLDRRIAKAAADIHTAVAESDTTLTDLCGIGSLTAGKILGRVGTIDRFRSAAAFATYTGTAPIDVSSGDVVRHRLSRARRSSTQPLPPRHGPYPDSPRHPRQGLLPTQAIPGQEPQRSDAMPQAATVRRRLPTTPPRRKQHGGRPGRTLGGGSIIQRGQLKPRTLTLWISHFPDPPPATLQLTDSGLLTQRGAVS